LSRESKDEVIGRLIDEMRAHDTANRAFDAVAFAKLGLNNTDGRCLDIIEREGPVTAGRLAQLSGLTTAAVTAVLDRLERAGYARRVRDEDDRRRITVELTPEFGRRAMKIWAPLGEDAVAEFRQLNIATLHAALDVVRRGRELNERHLDRVRRLELD
jgi:DNA-binding MarR family transcriptional regulator